MLKAERLREIEIKLDEYEQLFDQLSASASKTSATAVADAARREEIRHQIDVLEAELFQILKTPSTINEAERQTARECCALPRWFTLPMLALFFPERSPAWCEELLDSLLEFGEVELEPYVRDRYRIPKRTRSKLLEVWQQPHQWPQLVQWSQQLADYCAQQAEEPTPAGDDWRQEQLYHLVAADPPQALALLDQWIDTAVEAHFDLNQAHCWLQPLEERLELLERLAVAQSPPANWGQKLKEQRNYLAARTFWTEEWYRTIFYLPRSALVKQLDRFFGQPAEQRTDQPWLLKLHAPGGHGKTALIEWLLARYALPKGYVCARFDFNGLDMEELRTVAQQPTRILDYLAKNLNDQRAYKLHALERVAESHSDPVANFLLLLLGEYQGRIVLIFIDTLEVLLERTVEPEQHLRDLLEMLHRLHKGDADVSGTIRGYGQLRVVLSGRMDLVQRYTTVLQAVFATPVQTATLPVLDVQLAGFDRAEGERYLKEKRRLPDCQQALIDVMLDKASDVRMIQVGDASEARIEIVPLKLALLADLVKELPTITPEDIRKEDRIDLFYLVERILKRIDNHDLRLLLRYAVIFRRLDAEAAEVLLPTVDLTRQGNESKDDPKRDPESIRAMLAASRSLGHQPRADLAELLAQLTRYSWVTCQDGIIRFHPLVLEPQRQLLAKHHPSLFLELQQAAHEHYTARAARASDPVQQANYVREAIYHAFYLGETGARFWRAQLTRYQEGPGVVLWAIVDEAFRESRARSQPWLTKTDRCDGNLALARVLLAEKAEPFMPSVLKQLAEAEHAATIALAIAEDKKSLYNSYRALLLLAQIQLAQHKPEQAQASAEKCRGRAHEIDACAEAEAYKVLSQSQVANSRWTDALDSIRIAYTLSKQSQAGELSPQKQASHLVILLALVEQLLNSVDWRQAIEFLHEAQMLVRNQALSPLRAEYLAKAAELARRQAQLKTASDYYQSAVEALKGSADSTLLASQQLVTLLRGQLKVPITAQDPLVALTAVAARADWPQMETVLRQWESTWPEERKLTAINFLLQYYLEVVGNWRQVKALLERGKRLLTLYPTDPQVARFHVLRRYVELLTRSIELQPELAQVETRERLAEVEQLRTPEARVRAKALLLLVRFYGILDGNQASDEGERQAIQIYHNCARQALEQVFDLLLNALAPIDQVDVIRTLAVLPGWSSALVNHVAPAPSEANALYLLQRILSGQRHTTPSFLLRIMSPIWAPLEETLHGLWDRLPASLIGQRHITPLFLPRIAAPIWATLEEKLRRLGDQIHASQSDWPLLYTSYARLCAAFDYDRETLDNFLQKARAVSPEPLPSQVVLDLAYLSPWETSVPLLEETVARYQKQQEAKLATEVLQIGCAFWLEKGNRFEHRKRVSQWLAQLSEQMVMTQPTLSLLNFHLLQVVTALRKRQPSEQKPNLEQAVKTAATLSDPRTIATLTAIQQQIQAPNTAMRRAEPRSTTLAPAKEVVTAPPEHRVTPGNEVELDLTLTIRQKAQLAWVKLSGFSGKQPLTPRQHQTNLASLWTLPNSPLPTTLPTFDQWHKVLLPEASVFSPVRVGELMLNDLLGPEHRPFLASLIDQHRSAPCALHLVVHGSDLDYIPWGMLYLPEFQQWVAESFQISYNLPPLEPPLLQGVSLLVRPESVSSYEQMRAQQEIERIYASYTSQDRWLYWRQFIDSDDTSPEAVKSIHLLGNFSQWSDTEGVIFSAEGAEAEPNYTKTQTPIRRSQGLTADALAARLTRRGLDRTLVILEQLPTGLIMEDVRALLLRNRYTAMFARVHAGPMLVRGPHTFPEYRVERGFSGLLSRLLRETELTLPQLEQMVQQARCELLREEENPLTAQDIVLSAQIDLYYETS